MLDVLFQTCCCFFGFKNLALCIPFRRLASHSQSLDRRRFKKATEYVYCNEVLIVVALNLLLTSCERVPKGKLNPLKLFNLCKQPDTVRSRPFLHSGLFVYEILILLSYNAPFKSRNRSRCVFKPLQPLFS